MGRKTTSDIKQRKQTTIYLPINLVDDLEREHINVQHFFHRRVDKTLFIDAVFETGLKHSKEIQRLLKVYQ